MFPNAQDALPLPLRPNLERYKKLAKDLVKACKSADPDAIGDWAEAVGENARQTKRHQTRAQSFQRNPALDRTGRSIRAAQVIEREFSTVSSLQTHNLSSLDHTVLKVGPNSSKHLDELSQKSSLVARFESAADAICNGDVKTLKRLLREEPQLIHSRSTREHKATLLHYVSANGVEGYRQKTPKNIVEIAEVLLNAGADVNAEADVYGGGATTLGLVATSVHPFRAGCAKSSHADPVGPWCRNRSSNQCRKPAECREGMFGEWPW